MIRLSASERAAWQRKAHKYHAKPTTVDGIRFSSKAEAKRYGELKMLENAGEIRDLELQPKYQLVVPWHMGGTMAVIGTYVADFRYFKITKPTRNCGTQGSRVIEDVKGMKTPMYRWKKKHVEAQYGISITEVA